MTKTLEEAFKSYYRVVMSESMGSKLMTHYRNLIKEKYELTNKEFFTQYHTYVRELSTSQGYRWWEVDNGKKNMFSI